MSAETNVVSSPENSPKLPELNPATLGYRAAETIAIFRSTEPATVINFGIGRIVRKSITDTNPPLANLPEYARDVAHQDLATTRTRIAELNPKQRTQLEAYCGCVASEALSKIDPNNNGDHKVDWSEWMADRATDSQLLRFLSWHVGKIKEQQTNPHVKREIARQREGYKLAVAKGVQEGWLHEEAIKAIDAVDGIDVYIGDIFDTLMQERGGYHQPKTDFIVVGGSSDPARLNRLTVTSELKRIGWHEFNHATLGWLAYRWLDEAATEHIALSFKGGGSPELLSPFERTEAGHTLGAYVTERDFVSDLMTRGSQVIPTSFLTRTYSSQRTQVSKSGFHEFSQAINQAWPEYAKNGRTVLGQINDYVVALQTNFERQGFTLMQAQQKAMIQTQVLFLKHPEYIFTDKQRFLPSPIQPILAN